MESGIVSPSVNIIHHSFGFSSRQRELQVVFYPLYEVIFEGTFDDLMKEIG